ncbi:MAG: HAD family hydrolase [Verrucomicrobiia bacterium]|tara:strand:+ start:27406 stop:28005 length:600 start_codon:yes stop_codon:yes gene_type:complete
MQLELPDREYGGYIFDLDGTLIHSMPVHYRAWDAAMQRAGIGQSLDEDLFYSLGGVPTPLVALKLGEHYGITVDGEEVSHYKEELYLDLINSVELITPVVEFAREIAKSKPVAIATGGAAEVALPALEAVGLREVFSIVVTPADVGEGRGKPAPDMFLEAAKHINVPPHECVVFEDAVPGFEAAIAAGMALVKVPSRSF